MAQNVAPFRQVLLSAVTATTAVSAPVDCRGYKYLTAYCSGSGTVSSGVITLSEADFDPPIQGGTDLGYSGTWSTVTTVTASALTGGAQQAVHFPLGAYGFVQAAVTTTIGGGGTVSVVLRGE